MSSLSCEAGNPRPPPPVVLALQRRSSVEGEGFVGAGGHCVYEAHPGKDCTALSSHGTGALSWSNVWSPPSELVHTLTHHQLRQACQAECDALPFETGEGHCSCVVLKADGQCWLQSGLPATAAWPQRPQACDLAACGSDHDTAVTYTRRQPSTWDRDGAFCFPTIRFQTTHKFGTMLTQRFVGKNFKAWIPDGTLRPWYGFANRTQLQWSDYKACRWPRTKQRQFDTIVKVRISPRLDRTIVSSRMTSQPCSRQPTVVVLRDVFEATISGHLYHKSGRECWLNELGHPNPTNGTGSKNNWLQQSHWAQIAARNEYSTHWADVARPCQQTVIGTTCARRWQPPTKPQGWGHTWTSRARSSTRTRSR